MAVRSARLEAAVSDLASMRAQWESLGSPLFTEGSSGQLVPHPLVRMIREAERAVEMLSKPAAAQRGGRPVGASSAPDRRRPRLVVVESGGQGG
jgi:hypothetical protein